MIAQAQVRSELVGVYCADLDPALVARLGTVADDHLFVASTLTLVGIEILIDTHLTGKRAVDAAACFLCKTQTPTPWRLAPMAFIASNA
jgi:hypothetical protein